MTISGTFGPDAIGTLTKTLEEAGVNPNDLAKLFEEIMSRQGEGANGNAGNTPSVAPVGAAGVGAQATTSPHSSQPETPSGADASGGHGDNTVHIVNSSNHDETIGEFVNGGSTTSPVAEIKLKPGESGTLSYANGQGGYMAEADSSGAYQSTASRLEYYADDKGVNNTDVSYIDGRNAAIQVSDNQGKTAGDTDSIAGKASSDIVTKDAAGNATISGWYDGSTSAMQAGGAFMEKQLGTGNAYIHPNDDQNRSQASNPMTMAQDKSQNYTASFGDA